jgi:hypothetical protein
MDQINKAGIMSSLSVLQSDTHLEDIEVLLYFTSLFSINMIIVLVISFNINVAMLPAIYWLSAVSLVYVGIVCLESDILISVVFSLKPDTTF